MGVRPLLRMWKWLQKILQVKVFKNKALRVFVPNLRRSWNEQDLTEHEGVLSEGPTGGISS